LNSCAVTRRLEEVDRAPSEVPPAAVFSAVLSAATNLQASPRTVMHCAGDPDAKYCRLLQFRSMIQTERDLPGRIIVSFGVCT
jgi:hypothetical protein